MQPEPEQKHEKPREGDRIRWTTSILVDDPRYKITPIQQVISALIGGIITTFVGE